MNILITGACGGMGLAACNLLTKYGYNCIGIDIRYPKEEVPWRFFKVDLRNEEEIVSFINQMNEEGIKFDSIIHHAGIYDLNSLIEMNEEEVLRIFDINLFSLFRLNRLMIPLLNEGSKIIITSSELAPLNPLPFTGIYGITKTAVEKYAFSLRMEVQLLGIKVSVIRPGAVKTGLLDVSTSKLNEFIEKTEHYKCNAERFKKIVDSVETKSISPEKIAEVDYKILKKKNPKYTYNLNRNFGLKLLSALPKRMQTGIIRSILKEKK